jgi:hypothetical protein
MKKAGDLTAKIARDFSKTFATRDIEVIYDHGDPSIDGSARVGQIASWFGNKYNAHSRLALLDIAFIRKGSSDVLLLVEIEETSSDPKIILGDVFATLLGDHLKFQGKRDLNVSKNTSLLVMIKGGKDQVKDRLKYLENQVNNLKFIMSSDNAQLGKIAIRSYMSDNELREGLRSYLETWLA